jgi:hypothetical protein
MDKDLTHENEMGFEKIGLQILEALRNVTQMIDALLHRPAVINQNTYNYNAPHLENHGPVTYNAPQYYNSVPKTEETPPNIKKVEPDQIMKALMLCKAYIWGNAAYTVAFCVIRDDYNNAESVSSFERMLNERGIVLPEGTLNAAISRNPWMRYNVDKWEENGAMERAIKMRDFFRQQMLMAGLPDKDKETKA